MRWFTPKTIGPLVLALALGLSPAQKATADGEFFQLDAASTSGTAVGTIERGRFSFGALYTRYEGGAFTGISMLYGFPLPTGGTFRVGPAVAYTQDDDGPDRRDAGLRATLDRYVSTDFGGVYGLAEINTINSSWFVLGQVSHGASGFGIELSRGGSEDYNEGTLAVSKRIGQGPVSLRAGWRFFAREAFVGFSVNTF